MVDTDAPSLKFISGFALAIGAAIGSVVWVQPIVTVTLVGPGAVWLLPFTFLPLLLVLPAYITLSKAWPVSPGHYYYPSRLLFPKNQSAGQLVAFAVSWTFVLSMTLLALQLLALGAAGYLNSVFSSISVQLFSTGIVLLCLAIAWFGIRVVGRTEVILSTVLLLTLSSFLVTGIMNIEVGNVLSSAAPPVSSSLTATLLLSSMGVTGLYIIDLGGDMADAKSTVGKIVLYSCIINLTIVALITAIVVGVGPDVSQLAGRTIQYIALEYLPGPVVHMLAVGAMIAGVTTILGFIPIVTRHVMAQADDGIVPQLLTKENQHGEAGYLILLIAVVSVIMINSGIPINTIAAAASIINYLPILLITAVGIRLPSQYPEIFEKEMVKNTRILQPRVVQLSSAIGSLVIAVMLIASIRQTPTIAGVITVLFLASGVVICGIRRFQNKAEVSTIENLPL